MIAVWTEGKKGRVRDWHKKSRTAKLRHDQLLTNYNPMNILLKVLYYKVHLFGHNRSSEKHFFRSF